MVSIFKNAQKKLLTVKNPNFAVNKVFFCAFSKIPIKITFVRLLLAKTKEKYEENFFLGFYFKTQKCPFLWVNQFFSKFYFLVLAFKTIDTQMLFDQYF